MLEEVGLGYEVKRLRLEQMEQKQDWYLRINPNGRIPTIVDRDEGGFRRIRIRRHSHLPRREDGTTAAHGS
jgi:glutathione S-transferase